MNVYFISVATSSSLSPGSPVPKFNAAHGIHTYSPMATYDMVICTEWENKCKKALQTMMSYTCQRVLEI